MGSREKEGFFSEINSAQETTVKLVYVEALTDRAAGNVLANALWKDFRKLHFFPAGLYWVSRRIFSSYDHYFLLEWQNLLPSWRIATLQNFWCRKLETSSVSSLKFNAGLIWSSRWETCDLHGKIFIALQMSSSPTPILKAQRSLPVLIKKQKL